jgi:hypothetical protein
MAELNATEPPTSAPGEANISGIPHQVPISGPQTNNKSAPTGVQYDMQNDFASNDLSSDEIPGTDDRSNTFEEARRRASGWLEQTEAALTRSYRIGQKQVERLVSQGRQRISHTANERPLQLLAIVAGVAFFAGVALRLWRSSNYE